MLVASVFGLITSLFLAYSGDGSAYQVTQKQPMKLAAMEGLYQGQKGAGLVAFGILNPLKKPDDGQNAFAVKLEFPKLLSFLGYRDPDAFVPGIEDILNGSYKPEYNSIPPAEKENAFSMEEKISRGKKALNGLTEYHMGLKTNDDMAQELGKMQLHENFPYFGYAYLASPIKAVPNVQLTFYSFHFMVFMGLYFIILFIIVLFQISNDQISTKRILLRFCLWTIPVVYLATQAGWIVTEVGRQPWVIQDLMPTMAAVSKVSSASVQLTFWLFAVLFTALLIAEVMIMVRQIKIGPKELNG